MRSVTDVISLTQRNRSKCVDKKLSNKAFMEKAPIEIVEKVRNKVEIMNEKIDKLSK